MTEGVEALFSSLLEVGDSKTRAGEGRVVPLNDRATFTLLAWAREFPYRKPEHFVFPSERYGEGRAVYSTDPTRPLAHLRSGWEAARSRAKVVGRWHDLRHTFCTRLLEAGNALPQVAAIMGWSAATTAAMSKRYGHISLVALREVVGDLDTRDSGVAWAQNRAQSVAQSPLPR